MKIIKKILGIATAAVTAMSLCGSMTSSAIRIVAVSGPFQYGDYLSYQMMDDGGDGTYDYIKITDCSTEAVSVDVPSEIEEVPVKIIGDKAFQDCDILTNVIIPDSVTSIGMYAFYSCRSLESITLPHSLTNIENYAFSFCESLESITLPDSVTSIESYAFDNCDSLKSITIPDGVTRIEYGLFGCCDMLETVTLPDGLNKIEDEAFYGCKSLKSVTIPKNIESFNVSVVLNLCDSLESITIENPECEIRSEAWNLPETAVVYGYTNSTAQEYAGEYGYNFVSIGEYNPVVTTTEPEPIVTVDVSSLPFPIETTITTTTVFDPDYTTPTRTTITLPEGAFTTTSETNGNVTIITVIVSAIPSDTTTQVTQNQTTTSSAETVSGDVNNDNTVSLSDIVIIQKCLVKAKDFEIPDVSILDVNKDGRFNIFDLIIVKRILLY